jgi:uncharacterized radical SAM protein YgiQ
MNRLKFLPTSAADMKSRGWDYYDFLIITGDGYVDHPSFGAAVIGRLLEKEGYRAAILSQPDWRDNKAFKAMGRPRLAAMITAGNLDSMVAKYTAAKKPRSEDYYSPGKRAGLRPDHATVVYSNRVREAFFGLPVILGGLEASLRRFAHYDYWDNRVRRSVLADSKADLLVYGMGERQTAEIAAHLSAGVPIGELTGLRGTAFLTADRSACAFEAIECPSCEEVRQDKRAYAAAAKIQYDEHDAVSGRAVIQPHGDRLLIVNPPDLPLSSAELDGVAALPFEREPHPMYQDMGGIPAIEEVRFSIIHNRGCFGACNFCALAFHQGRTVSSRSHESVLNEARSFLKHPEFKGYIHDVGGPTANFRAPSCQKQLKEGMCRNRRCLAPQACPMLEVDHADYLELLRKLRAIPGVKKVFVRSGLRFDYIMADKNGEFLSELVEHHISGQLKVAPEHCVDPVLGFMGKPRQEVYESFAVKYERLNKKHNKNQFIVPYLMSSHPGCTLKDAVELAVRLHSEGRSPEQVQDFYPTPGTLSTCMYYTGIDPRTMKSVYVARTFREKAMQRALLQWGRPDKRRLIIEALKEAGREDLIGNHKGCLVRPMGPARRSPGAGKRSDGRTKDLPSSARKGRVEKGDHKEAEPVSKKGWAKAKPKKKGGRPKKHTQKS